MNLLWALLTSLGISLISLIGIFSLFIKDKLLNNILLLLVGFSGGTLIGGAFLHLLPETLKKSFQITNTFLYLIIGFVIFFILEKYLFWRHCHEKICEVHSFTYMNLIGDGIHNLIDGLLIGASFYADIKIAIAVSIAIIMHEIPQELGDFAVLVYGGFSKYKALLFNFLSGATAMIGTLIGYFFAANTINFTLILFPIAAGGFIYIAACDLIPELHRQPDTKKSNISILFFILGILLMLLFTSNK